MNIFIITYLSYQTLLFLLNIAGVELNPGPQSVCCSYCLLSPISDPLEYSVCFRRFHPQCVSNNSSTMSRVTHLLNIKGKLIYICANCCSSSDKINIEPFSIEQAPQNDHPNTTLTHHQLQLSQMENSPGSRILVCPKKRNFSNLLKPVVIQPTNEVLKPMTLESHPKVPSLLSLTLKPPPAVIFLKWGKYFLNEKRERGANCNALHRLQPIKSLQTNTCSKYAKCDLTYEVRQPFRRDSGLNPYVVPISIQVYKRLNSSFLKSQIKSSETTKLIC